MKLHLKDFKLADGRWLRYKGPGAITLPHGPKWTDNAMWKHPDGLMVIATVEDRNGSPLLHVSMSHRSREISDKDCTLMADALFPVSAVVEKRGEVAEFGEKDGHSYGGVVHLVTPIGAADVDSIPAATKLAMGKLIARMLERRNSG